MLIEANIKNLKLVMTVRAGSSIYEYLIRPQLRKFKSDEQLIVGIRIRKMIFYSFVPRLVFFIAGSRL